MRYSILLSAIALFFISCSKDIENRLVGNWKLEEVYKRSGLGKKEVIVTGYENGILTMIEGGAAQFIKGQDTLTGFWRSDLVQTGTGESSQSVKNLRIHVADFPQNKWLEWEFDNFDFRNNKQEIKAKDESIGKDRFYVFTRQ